MKDNAWYEVTPEVRAWLDTFQGQRIEKNISQEAVSKGGDITQAALSGIERGVQLKTGSRFAVTTWEKLVAVADLLGIKPIAAPPYATAKTYTPRGPSKKVVRVTQSRKPGPVAAATAPTRSATAAIDAATKEEAYILLMRLVADGALSPLAVVRLISAVRDAREWV